MATVAQTTPLLDSSTTIETPYYVIYQRPDQILSSQYLCGTEKPDTQHVVHEVKVLDRQGKPHKVRALLDCGASSMFISPGLRKLLNLDTAPAWTTTYGLDGAVLAHARNSRKVNISVQYFDHLAPVEETNVLEVAMAAYELVLGLPWFQARKPVVDWAARRLLSLQLEGSNSPEGDAPSQGSNGDPGSGADDYEDPSRRSREARAAAAGVEIEMVSARAFRHLLRGQEVACAFALRTEECEPMRVEETSHEGMRVTPRLADWRWASKQ
jgi:hypothetical protein